jgi:hypothetical protein
MFEDSFEASAGESGVWSTISDIAGRYFDYRTKTTPQAVRWMPTDASGLQRGVAADGSIILRGTPVPNTVNSVFAGVASLLPLALVVGAVLLVVRALK